MPKLQPSVSTVGGHSPTATPTISWSMTRTRSFDPPPHVFEQAVQSDQSPTVHEGNGKEGTGVGTALFSLGSLGSSSVSSSLSRGRGELI
jgi:hypothetical protein